MTADAFIHCRVTSEMKAVARTLAAREGITESKLVKQLLESLLRTGAVGDPSAPLAQDTLNRQALLCVRLNPEDRRLLTERANSRRMPSATYVALLASACASAWRRSAPLPKAEYLALRESVLQLTGIGRNLIQIAGAMHRGGNPALPGPTEVGAMLKLAEALRDHFKSLLKANELSWRTHAPNSL